MPDQNYKSQEERIKQIVDLCLETDVAYKLFACLAHVSQMDLEAKLQYLALVRETSMYTEEEIQAIERLIMSGSAQHFWDLLNLRRDQQIQGEITELTES